MKGKEASKNKEAKSNFKYDKSIPTDDDISKFFIIFLKFTINFRKER